MLQILHSICVDSPLIGERGMEDPCHGIHLPHDFAVQALLNLEYFSAIRPIGKHQVVVEPAADFAAVFAVEEGLVVVGLDGSLLAFAHGASWQR